MRCWIKYLFYLEINFKYFRNSKNSSRWDYFRKKCKFGEKTASSRCQIKTGANETNAFQIASLLMRWRFLNYSLRLIWFMQLRTNNLLMFISYKQTISALNIIPEFRLLTLINKDRTCVVILIVNALGTCVALVASHLLWYNNVTFHPQHCSLKETIFSFLQQVITAQLHRLTRIDLYLAVSFVSTGFTSSAHDEDVYFRNRIIQMLSLT